MKRAWIVAVALGLVLGCEGDGSTKQPHQTMGEIFENVVALLPPSVDPEDFGNPDSRVAIAERLELRVAAATIVGRRRRRSHSSAAC